MCQERLFSQVRNPDEQSGQWSSRLIWSSGVGKDQRQLLLPDIPCGNHCANDSFPNIHTKRYGMGGNLHGLCTVISLPVFAPLLSSFAYLKAVEAPANNTGKKSWFFCASTLRDIVSREVSVCECVEAWMSENVSEQATWPVSDHPFPWVIIY